VVDGANDMGSFAGADEGKFQRIYRIRSSSPLENSKNWSWHFWSMHHPRHASTTQWIWSRPSTRSLSSMFMDA